MKPPLLNFEIFWKDLDQKTPEKRPKTRSKFVKSTNSCHWEFSSSFWCVIFSLLALDFDFFLGTKTQTNLITPGKPGFQTVFLFFKWVLFERIFILIFQICDFTNFFWPLWPSYFDFSFFFLRCTTQLQLTAAHSTTAYRPQSFDEITQSVWSERYKYSKVFCFKCQIILK